jgi:hypothetical protein
MRPRHRSGFAAFLVLLAACSQEPESARYTVEEYRANAALLEAKVRECANDPGTLGKTPDCVNAVRAALLEQRGSLRKSAPVGLDPARNPLGNRESPPEQGEDPRTPAPDAPPPSTR